MSVPPSFQRTSLELFRDCLRLVRHIAPGHSAKSQALRATIRTQFAMGRHETDPVQIQRLQANAIRALSNYMLYESGTKDPILSKAMKTYHQESVLKAKQQHEKQQQPPQPYDTSGN